MQNNRRFEKEPSEFKERLVSINRVAKVVKGGKNFRFTALMVVGNEKGKVGVGLGTEPRRAGPQRILERCGHGQVRIRGSSRM